MTTASRAGESNPRATKRTGGSAPVREDATTKAGPSAASNADLSRWRRRARTFAWACGVVACEAACKAACKAACEATGDRAATGD